MRYLSLYEVIQIHQKVVSTTGGGAGIRDIGLLESAVSQPRLTFAGADLYPTVADKAAALCFSIVMGHPFVDGNKRTGHAAMETFLIRMALRYWPRCRSRRIRCFGWRQAT